MSFEHRMQVNTFSRYLPSPLSLDSSENLSFLLDLSEEPPPIAPEIVPARRLMAPATEDESRCVGDVKERMGGFDMRGMDTVDEVGDRILSVDTGEARSAARTVSKPPSVGTFSTRAPSPEYAEEETDGL